MMKRIFYYLLSAISCMMLWAACSEDSGKDGPEGPGGNGGGNEPGETLGGYADPDGVLILNGGSRPNENGSLTYIAPDGTVEENVYKSVNGTELGNDARDLYMCNGKLYILCNDQLHYEGIPAGDGVLIIADAVTLKKEKVFTRDQLQFPRPPETNGESEYMQVMSLKNIVVMDEENIYFSDAQGLFRFNSKTGGNVIVKGSYALANQGSPVHNLETIVSTRGMTVIGDRLYSCASGFWTSTKLLEFVKGKDEVNRELELPKGDFISGICKNGEHELIVGTCGRLGEGSNFLHFIDLDTWTITQTKAIGSEISAEFRDSPGITLCGDHIYHAAGSTTVGRTSIKTWKPEPAYIDITADEPTAQYLNCNVVADPVKQYLYVAVSQEYAENVVSPGNILVYDISGDEPKLVQNITGKTSYPNGIYPVSQFY